MSLYQFAFRERFAESPPTAFGLSVTAYGISHSLLWYQEGRYLGSFCLCSIFALFSRYRSTRTLLGKTRLYSFSEATLLVMIASSVASSRARCLFVTLTAVAGCNHA